MWDAVNFARQKGILCQGRGSAANSAVAYCLAITAVDPVRHGLLFERFLSEIRVDGQTEAPDIDVDIEHDRREEVLDYVYDKYNRANAAITCIIQMYRGPNAILDSMRAFGYPVEMATNFSKRLHWSDPAEGAKYIEETLAPKFGLDLDNPRGKATLAAMAAFEGVPRLRSTHVGGFVLSSAPLGDYMPVEHTTMGRTIIQFDKDDLDAVGVPKFDFLGLGALSLVRRAFDMIEARTGTRPEMYKLPPDDEKTYDLIAHGETIGTFQIESRAQIASVLHTKPERLYDIVVQVALIRPGPIQANFVHPYTARRRGLEPVTYLHPDLEPILKRTQGIPIFQEQAMAIAMALGGYTPAEADLLRRTMGNQRKEPLLIAALAELRERMIAGHVAPPVAEQIEADLRSFANYGFPESHAWSFALIAYATAWLKTNHPTEFYLGLLNAQPMGFYSVSTLLHDARRHGVPLRPPCLRDGFRDSTSEPDVDPAKPALRVGWRFIRGIGSAALDALEAAQQAAPFRSIADVVQRTHLERTNAIALAQGDAFAAWEPDRHRAAWEALRAAGDTMPLAPARDAALATRTMSRHERIFLDYFATGFCLDGHPMEALRKKLDRLGVQESRSLTDVAHRETVMVSGLIIARQRPQTANGTVFLLLEDEHGHINVIVPNTIEGKDREAVKHAMVILVLGRVERDGPVLQVVGSRFQALQVDGLTYNSRDFR